MLGTLTNLVFIDETRCVAVHLHKLFFDLKQIFMRALAEPQQLLCPVETETVCVFVCVCELNSVCPIRLRQI
jgi:hypothetical protein